MSFRRIALLAASAWAFACSGEERPAPLNMPLTQPDAKAPEAGTLDAGFRDGPPPADAAGLCGNQFFEFMQEPPNLYFVLDRSGSMQDYVGPNTTMRKYTAVRKACVELVRQLGSRANIGAAVFPGTPELDGCSAGKEVFSTRPGDPPGSFGSGVGPVSSLFAATTNVAPLGGTPTAATLEMLRPILQSLEGKTFVVLATDGGPNCSWAHACGPQDCIWNIESAQLYDEPCTGSHNCCSSDIAGGPGPQGCLDGASTVAVVAAMRDRGIRTFVVGIPGSQHYASLLDQLATVGGTARPSSSQYYRVDDVATLGDTLAVIGRRALMTCDFVLNERPPDANLVNVYLDGHSLVYDENDGWTWTGEKTLSLHGVSCEKLEQGEAYQLQVVAGCPTQQPR